MTALLEGTYFLSILSFLGGLKFLSSPKKAKLGNTIAALGMVSAIVISVFSYQSNMLSGLNYVLITSMLVAGTLIGRYLSNKVAMTQMPQLVSFFNATGGACAFLLGISEANQLTTFTGLEKSILLTGSITGAIAASGSIVALQKLSGKLRDHRSLLLKISSKVLLLALVGITVMASVGWFNFDFLYYTIILVVIALLYGILFVLPIGGADMPVVISLLNAVTGIATAFAGALYQNKVMLAGGIIVGAAGILLTVMMCKAMNRSLFKVLTGSFNTPKAAQGELKEQQIIETSISETALKLSLAKKVAIIPGYGLAVAQAQHLCSQIEDLLAALGVEVHYIIHPVAGRMPGHMNVLLAEASVEYDALKEMEEVNDHMASYDVALIIGANDVVNPAAEQDQDSPIYGMPIIKAYQCQSSIVLKRGMSTGYAGVQNALFDTKGCKLLFGDAKVSLQKILNELKLL